MNILLINPWIYDFAAFDLWLKPLGLLYLASFLEEHGHSVALIDCLDRLHPSVAEQTTFKAWGTGKFYSEPVEKPTVLSFLPRTFKRYGIPDHVYIDEIKNHSPNVVVLTSMMTYWYPGVFNAIQWVKQHHPNVPIILGGVYATLCSHHARHYSGADYIIEGAGTLPVLKIADSIAGIKRDYTTISTDIDNLPFPAYHLYPQLRTISMLTSLGCPLDCSYCASKQLQTQFTERTAENVLSEMSFYKDRFNIQDIAFYDDALLINAQKRFIPLAKKIAHNKLDVRLHTPNGLHIRKITAGIADLLYQANFKTIRLSFESTSTRIQKNSTFKTNNDDLINAQGHLHKAGYSNKDIEVYILVGLPKQSMQEIIETIEFVHSCGIKIKLALYSPIPTTDDFKTVAAKHPDIEDEPLLQNNTVYTAMLDAIEYQRILDLKNHVKKLNTALESGSC